MTPESLTANYTYINGDGNRYTVIPAVIEYTATEYRVVNLVDNSVLFSEALEEKLSAKEQGKKEKVFYVADTQGIYISYSHMMDELENLS